MTDSPGRKVSAVHSNPRKLFAQGFVARLSCICRSIVGRQQREPLIRPFDERGGSLYGLTRPFPGWGFLCVRFPFVCDCLFSLLGWKSGIGKQPWFLPACCLPPPSSHVYFEAEESSLPALVPMRIYEEALSFSTPRMRPRKNRSSLSYHSCPCVASGDILFPASAPSFSGAG